MTQPGLTVSIGVQGDRATVRLLGELDIATVPQLDGAVHDLLYLGARSILIDLRHMDFIDSSGLGLFMLLGDRCSREGWELSLTHPPDRSAAIFRITGTGERLPFVGEPAAAAL